MNPPRLVRSGLTGRIYVLTRYKITGQHPETGVDLIEAQTKYDVTEDFEALTARLEREAVEMGGMTEADAALIAAAPDLLAALKGCAEALSMKTGYGEQRWYRRAKEAIAKAEQAQPNVKQSEQLP